MRVLLSLLALGGGVTILLASLLAVTPVQSASGVSDASQRQLYFSEEILPDHIGYPVLMAVDRARLETAVPTERVYMQIEYGARRLEYAHALLEKDNPSLAVTTATKGYKYLLQAAQESLDQDMPASVRQYALKALEYHLKDMSTLTATMTGEQRAILDQFQEQGRIVVRELHSSLASST